MGPLSGGAQVGWQLPGAQEGQHGEEGSWSSHGVTAVRGAPHLSAAGPPGPGSALNSPP